MLCILCVGTSDRDYHFFLDPLSTISDRSNWYNAQFALYCCLRVESRMARINVQLVMRLQK